jgi:hypothetical protein
MATKLVQITLPYRRGCFSPQMAAYLQEVERMLSVTLEAHRPEIQQAKNDLIAFGTCTIRRE